MREKHYVMKNEEDTRQFGCQLAQSLKPGAVVALMGDLGTGKTAMTKAVAVGLGIHEMITSPTFTIVQEYHSGRLPLYHFDVYRIQDSEEMFELGYEEYFYGKGVCVVEWADLIEDLLPDNSVVIHLEYGDTETERRYAVCDGRGKV